MSARQKFILIGGGPKGLDAKLMAEWDFDVICFDLTENIQKYHENLSKVAALYEIKDAKDYPSIVRLARRAYQEHPFANVVSFTEWGLMPAAHICEAFGFKGNGVASVAVTVDKFEMRKLLGDSGLSRIRYAEIKSFDQFEKFCREVGCRCVIKCRSGSGKTGVVIVRDADDLVKFGLEVRTYLEEYGSLLAEEFVDGREYSIETFMWDGELKFIAYTKKHNAPPYNIEVGHTMPANIPDKLKEEIKKYVVSCLHALGVRYGICHTEVIVADNGPHFVETHVRPGGDHIYDLLIYAHGVDVIKTSCQYASGDELPVVCAAGRSAGIRFLNPPEGRYEKIDGMEAVIKNPLVKDYSLELPEDGYLKSIRGNHMTHSYFVMCDECNADELDAALDRVLSQIVFVPGM